jgi:hypothetical protein
MCRHYRAHALLYAHTRATTITINHSHLWEMSCYHAGGLVSEEPSSRIACRLLASKQVHFPHLLALSLTAELTQHLYSALAAVAELTQLTLLTFATTGELWLSEHATELSLWNEDVQHRVRYVVVPALTHLQILKLQMLETCEQIRDSQELQLFLHLSSLTSLTELDWGVVVDYGNDDDWYHSEQAAPLVDALPALPALRTLTLRDWDVSWIEDYCYGNLDALIQQVRTTGAPLTVNQQLPHSLHRLHTPESQALA